MHHILIFLTLYIMNIESARGTSLPIGNYSNAEVVCKDHGGLASNEIFDDNNGKVLPDFIQDAASQLEERDTAWIKGYVEFSKFVSWHGCYSENHSVIKIQMHNTSIDKCLHKCTTNSFQNIKVEYIGLRKDLCYCLTTNDTLSNINPHTYIKCNQQKPYFTQYNYTNEQVIDVFSIVNTHDWVPNPPSLNQCVYTKSISTTYKYAATSCYGNTDRHVRGFICGNGATQKLNKSCESFYEGNVNSPAFCVNNHSTSWMEAYKHCIDYSGKLIDSISPRIAKQLPKRESYWIGMFRSFKITGVSSRIHEVPTACLAVTKITDRLVLDPDNCSAHKMIICADGIYGKTSYSSTSMKTTHGIMAPTDESANSKTEHRAGIRADFIYITVAVTLIAVVALASCFIARRFKTSSNEEHLLEHLSQSVGNDYEIAVYKNVPSSTNACTDMSVRREIIINKPNKPPRRTLRSQKLYSPYENFKLKFKTIKGSHTPIENASTDYDRVELKAPVGKKKTPGVEETDECSVYDHTTQTGESENYDTIKSTKSAHYVDNNTYNTIKNKAVCINQSQHCLSEDNDENSTCDAHVENEYNTIYVMQSVETEADQIDKG